MLELQDLVIGYQKPLLGPINLRLESGIHVLLGKNGSGKTTLMRTIAGILPPLAGCIRLGQDSGYDHNLTKTDSRIGYLGHRAALSESLSVGQNLHFWQRIAQLYAPPTALNTVAEAFQLQELWHQRIRQLSRGQRQRTDLARLTLTPADVLLLDEPFTGLDPVQAQHIRQKMRKWAQHRPLIYSTHSLSEALEMSDHFLLVGQHTLESVTARQETDLLHALENAR